MSNNLGEIFYNGRIINLSSVDEQELMKMVDELENSQAKNKETIKNILNKMRLEA